MPDDLTTKIQQARQAGYSDEDIVGHLAQSDPRVKQAVGAGYKPSEIVAHLAPASWSNKLGIENPVARAGVDFAEGVAASAAEGVFGAGDLIRRATGSRRIINNPDVQQAMRAPDSLAGKAGKFGGEMASFVLPGGAVSKLTKGASLATRAVAQGATAAAVSGAQTGGDPAAMGLAAALGAGAEAVPAAMAASRVPAMLKESAAKGYGQALAATKQGDKFLSQNQVVPGLLNRGEIALSLKRLLNKAENRAEFFGRAIGEAWEQLPADSRIALDSITSGMTKSADEMLTIPASNGARVPVTEYARQALGHMQTLKETLASVAERSPETGALEVPVQKLRQLRQAWDEVASQAKVYQGQQLADHAIGKIHAKAADAIREQLAAEFPDIAAINKEYSFWRNVQKVVGDTVLRKEGQAKPLSQQIAAAGGMAVGGATGGLHGAFMGKMMLEAVQKAVNSPLWKTTSAVYKNRLADAIAKGNSGEAASISSKILRGAALESTSKVTASPEPPIGPLVPVPAQ